MLNKYRYNAVILLARSILTLYTLLHVYVHVYMLVPCLRLHIAHIYTQVSACTSTGLMLCRLYIEEMHYRNYIEMKSSEVLCKRCNLYKLR